MSRSEMDSRGNGRRIAAGAAALLVPILALAAASALRAAPEPPRPTIPGKFVWFDLLTTDAPAAEKFYGGLFGWTFEVQKTRENPYKVARLGGTPIAGIVDVSARKSEVPDSTWLSFTSVPDVDKAAAEIRNRKGKVLREPADVGGSARAAVVADPQGALLGLVKLAKGDPPDGGQVREGTFLWMEYVADDAPGALAFYKDALGFDVNRLDAVTAVEYFVLKTGGISRAGLYASPWKEVKSNWLPYIRVADATAAARKVESLGGRVLLAPKPDIRNGTLAIVADPSGAAVALQQWPIAGPAK
jgi:uncharacterized protein